MRSCTALLSIVAASLLVAGCTLGASEDASSGSSSTSFTVVIPAGASDMPSRELLGHLPQEPAESGLRLLFSVGETLTVVNNDSVEHTIGLVVVRPGEVLTYAFSVPGTFTGACTLLAGEDISIVVS